MAPETSQFESSEMLATFLASTPLVEESWRLCSRANIGHRRSFAVNMVGQVAYVAFSGVQVVGCAADLVEVESCAKGILTSFCSPVEGKEAVMVHAGLLQLFLSFYEDHNFQQKVSEILKVSKSVVFAGHCLGGAVASLSAVWLLSCIQTTTTSVPIFCITYGSPLLGNESFSQAILRQRWAGNFCHFVGQHDIIPRLLFAPLLVPHLHIIWSYLVQLSDHKKDELFNKVLACAKGRLRQGVKDEEITPYWPFGSYMFCTEKGAICLDNGAAIVKFLYLTMAEGCANSCIQDHFEYEYYVAKLYQQYLRKEKCMEVIMNFSGSSSEVGIALALASSGVSSQEPFYGTAMKCLIKARESRWRPNLNSAKMAVYLSQITPLRVQLEKYKVFCDDSSDQFGYYDSFKRRGANASKRDIQVNKNRIRLGVFWNVLIEKLEQNELTHDFHMLTKYVNASQSYKLLVEPLEIAEYYKTDMQREKGHYIEHGREKRFKIFDKWWGDRKVGDEESKARSKYASLTQDSCFWARVEESLDYMNRVADETEPGRRLVLLDKIEKFEEYANGMIRRKEVSVDVLAKNSSYSQFTEKWRQVKQLLPLHYFPGFEDGMVR